MQRRGSIISLILILSLTLTLAVTPRVYAKENVLYRFRGGTDGAIPLSSLVMDSAGNLYGTTADGGNRQDCKLNSIPGCGVVFELAPSGNGKWQEVVLYTFQGGSDGSTPSGNLVFDALGNLYGTTAGGGSGVCGSNGCGTVFELTPNQDGSWSETVLYSFQAGSDGAFPAGLTFGASGDLFGITTAGGSGRYGTVYRLAPPQRRDGAWTEKTLYSFSQFEVAPNPGLVFDKNGNLYGSYYQLYSCYPGCGAVFELKRAHGSWTESDLFLFQGGGNGGEPMAGVTLGNHGNLYGTAMDGGNNFGIAFELKHSGGQWKEVMIHDFCSLNNCADGAAPRAALAMDGNGVLYGTASTGGKCLQNCGVLFKLVQTENGWKEAVLHGFQGGRDGSYPIGQLIIDGNGNIYGVTEAGGGTGCDFTGCGTVFRVSP